MRWKRLRRLRLAQALLLLLVPSLLVLTLAELKVAARDVQRAADNAYDRSLLGALKSVDASVSTQSGGLSVELPYRLFEFFELTASGPVYYRIATADGLVELGSADLPQPPAPLRLGVPQFYDGTYFGNAVRVAAYMRNLPRGSTGSSTDAVIIQVAETTQARREFKRVLLTQTAESSMGFLALTVLCAAGAIMFVLRPLTAVSRELSARSGSDMAPIPLDDLPADVRPLAEAMNTHMLRAHDLAVHQRNFLDDASHQLRTHLTTLRVQVEYAARVGEPARMRDAVAALATELQRATRSTTQLLSLGRSDAASLQPQWIELHELLAGVVREFLPAARAKGLDLGMEEEAPRAWGDPELLREAVVNLVANAIAYTAAGSVTLAASADARIWTVVVEDTGPGLPAEVAASAGARFLRSSRDGGSGLGLAIARSIATRHGGGLRLQAGPCRRGLRASIWWPVPPHHGQEA
ncbi:sensor histidine kinase [Variovorax ureilyticus]|uniref:histidine kinase n=1 Tax=Variovorax ureilyticus TaxID=1836198 RepID=A0ABU8VL09_9BURK